MRIVRYTIKVEALVEQVRIIGKRWEVVDRGSDDRAVYGYTPETTGTTCESVDLYEQTVETLDIAALVSVVNHPPRAAVIEKAFEKVAGQ